MSYYIWKQIITDMFRRAVDLNFDVLMKLYLFIVIGN